MQNLTGWKAVLAAILIVGTICAKVFYQTPQYRNIGSGTWNIPAGDTLWQEIKASKATKLQFELTRTTPGPFSVFLIDAASHARLQTLPPNAPLPANLNVIYQSEATTTLTAQEIQLSAGAFFLYTVNNENVPIAVNYRLAEYR
jgi:hypothetical protein